MGRPGHQLAVSDAIGSSFTVMSQNFVGFMALGIIFTLPNLIITMNPSTDPGVFDTLLKAAVSTACSLMLTGSLVYGVYQTLRGKNVSLGDSISVGISKMLPVLGVMFVTALGIMFGLLLFIIPGIILMLMWYVAIPCAILEGTGISESMERSKFLTAGKRGTIFGIVVVLFFLSILIAMPVGMIVGSPYEVAFEGGEVVIKNNMFATLANFLLQAFFAVLSACASAVVYQSLRIEKEGGDLDSIAAVFD